MSHEVEDTYDVYDEEERKARTAHVCDACHEQIGPGQRYTVVGIVWERRAETVKRCARCQAIHEHLRDLGGGDMWPDEKLNCGEAYQDHWGKEPPEHIAALAFWRPGDPKP